MKVRIILITVFATLLGLVSCDTKPKANDDIILPPPIKGSIMMVNEGNFQFGNSSLTVYDFNKDIIYPDVFEKTNNRKLGDVFQSVTVAYGKAYLVVNNSQKIEVVDPENYQSIATITGFRSPRYMLAVSPTKAYVTEYYCNQIRIVDLNTHTITDSIRMDGWMDEMVLLNNKVYVTNLKKNYILGIDIATNAITDTIKCAYGSIGIQVDANNKIWVLCNGDMTRSIHPALQRLNPISNTVEQNFPLNFSEMNVSRLRMNNAKTKLYWLSKHVFVMGIADQVVATKPLVMAGNQNFYGLGVDPKTNELYVSDVKDFVQQSVVYRYRSSGSLIGDFKAGLITGGFYFYYP
ncbi:MAG: DUF5074 domain-containing protein [Bacteroidota bacterium]